MSTDSGSHPKTIHGQQRSSKRLAQEPESQSSSAKAHQMASEHGSTVGLRTIIRGVPPHTCPCPNSPPMGVRSRVDASSQIALLTVRGADRGYAVCSVSLNSDVECLVCSSRQYQFAVVNRYAILTQMSCHVAKSRIPLVLRSRARGVSIPWWSTSHETLSHLLKASTCFGPRRPVEAQSDGLLRNSSTHSRRRPNPLKRLRAGLAGSIKRKCKHLYRCSVAL